ncbi:MAG: aminotransferase class V-fold PLP-dependent enzyme [Desulfobacterales bacterium]|nr:aminotransferase class V-fold PLP-dependent enzyme [Desulfobacterales bacterium]
MAEYATIQPKTDLVADWERLFKVFIRPEDDDCRATLIKYMERILFGLHDFLKKNVGITEARSLKDLSESFTDTLISENPEKKLADVITCLIKEIAPHAVNVASPYFVGHMTSAIPFFMVHLKTIVAALNQNVVKLETSKVVSIIEKQVIAKIHRMIYDKTEAFYREHVQNADTSLGAFVEGGTTAAYDRAQHVSDVVVALRDLLSSMGAGGRITHQEDILPIDLDASNKINIHHLKNTISRLKTHSPRTCILAIVGIAGATETGTVDPLEQIAEICSRHKIHFHVDAAWGGATLFSKKYRHLLSGIDFADSVTIDGHKQFYMPMSCGMLYFKDPLSMDAIAYHANYVNRWGSVDLGIKTLSGSREANSLVLDCALKIMGAKGYSLLIDHGIETAADFAEEIRSRDNFQLVTPPELNILTYRICPRNLQNRLMRVGADERRQINQKLNAVNRDLQRIQREAGSSFVSRTKFKVNNDPDDEIVVLRSVIMNPMTTISILREILDEQEEIFLKQLQHLI